MRDFDVRTALRREIDQQQLGDDRTRIVEEMVRARRRSRPTSPAARQTFLRPTLR